MAITIKKTTSRKSKDSTGAPRKDLRRSKDSAASQFFETSQLIEISLFILFSALVVSICFL